MSSKDNQPQDLALFRELMQDVQPIKYDKADLQVAASKDQVNLNARRLAATQDNPSQLLDGLSDGQVKPVNPGEALTFHLPDLPWRQLQALKKGQIAWQEGLDLHGYTLEEARQELTKFIREGLNQGFRCLLLVHGKAYNRAGETPSIKSHINAWLRQMPDVLAFTSALPADGGTGAVYILLKSSKRR